jgi:Uma2 family endonuclease
VLVEVLSHSNRRHGEIRKCKLYEQFGVTAYWIVDPESETVKVYRLEESTYGPSALFGRPYNETLETPRLPGFKLVLGDVFAE